jgi:hypothetical protein
MAFSGFHPAPEHGSPPDAGAHTDPSEHAAILSAQFHSAIAAVRNVSTQVATYDQVSDHTIRELHVLAAENATLSAALLAVTAGQIARRSAPERGSEGMARQSGHRTPEEMARALGKISRHDAARAVRQGKLIHTTQTLDDAEATGAPPINPSTGQELIDDEPWLASVGRALTEGLSVDAADAIRRGLGVPSEEATVEMLSRAAEELCRNASRLDPDRLFQRARRLRDEIDAAGIGLREHERRERRTLTFRQQPDGMSRLVWLMDPETAAVVGDVYDRATSPRRGGPRSADAATAEHATQIATDDRSTDQLASDVFAQLLQNGVATDASLVLGTGTPSIRIVTTRVSSPGDPARFGVGWIEGQQDPVSPETVERLTCTGATIEVTVDEQGHPIDVASEQRLFSRKQRIGFGVRDGGCTWVDDLGDTDALDGSAAAVGCDRPPSWTEAHHVEQWNRDGGKTTARNGTLLCKFHHLLLHNENWDIRLLEGNFWLIPPVTVDPSQTPRRMRTRKDRYLPDSRPNAAYTHAPATGPKPTSGPTPASGPTAAPASAAAPVSAAAPAPSSVSGPPSTSGPSESGPTIDSAPPAHALAFTTESMNPAAPPVASVAESDSEYSRTGLRMTYRIVPRRDSAPDTGSAGGHTGL